MNWVLLPGGAGVGSDSLGGLAGILEMPGTIWLVDLPGDGSNRPAPSAPGSVSDSWPGVVAGAAQALPDPVFAGHATVACTCSPRRPSGRT